MTTQLLSVQGMSETGAFDLLDVSEATRTDYKYRISMFLDFTSTNGLQRDSFIHYKRFLKGRTDFSVSTKNKYLSTAKIFLKEANRQGLLAADITQNTHGFNQSSKHKVDGLNDQEIETLAASLAALPETPENSRLQAIITLLALQGLRQIELARLDVSDIDLIGKTALVLGKGRDDKERIALQPETVNALHTYLKSNKKADGALFTSNSYNGKNERLTTRSIRRIVQTALKAAGITKTTHGFRHYYATKLIKDYRGDLPTVARYTRHKSIETLQVYNDAIIEKADLPKYYGVFSGLSFA